MLPACLFLRSNLRLNRLNNFPKSIVGFIYIKNESLVKSRREKLEFFDQVKRTPIYKNNLLD